MKIPKPYNPLSLNLGQLVTIKQYSKVEYDESGNKIVQKIASKPKLVIITGVVKRALGKYNKGYSSSSSLYESGDYEQASLSVSKYVWLYETREQINSPARLVSPEDITT